MASDVITTVVEDVAGNDVLPLVDVLKGRKNVSEFTIAEELKEGINTIRNKLYRLYDSNLVEFTRKKDMKKGWYIYYWTFVPSRIPYLLKSMKKKKLEKLKDRLKAEQNTHFFECPDKCMRLTFDKAIDFEFKCPECGKLMNQEDNTKKVVHILKEIERLEKEIESEPDLVIEAPFEEIEEKKETIKPKKMAKNRIKIIQKEMKVKKVFSKFGKRK